jgi:hypothetical protein
MARIRRLIKEDLGIGMSYVKCDDYNKKQAGIEYWKRVDRAYEYIEEECMDCRDMARDWQDSIEFIGDNY